MVRIVVEFLFEVPPVVVLHEAPPDKQGEAGEHYPFERVEEIEPVDLLGRRLGTDFQGLQGSVNGRRGQVGPGGR